MSNGKRSNRRSNHHSAKATSAEQSSGDNDTVINDSSSKDYSDPSTRRPKQGESPLTQNAVKSTKFRPKTTNTPRTTKDSIEYAEPDFSSPILSWGNLKQDMIQNPLRIIGSVEIDIRPFFSLVDTFVEITTKAEQELPATRKYLPIAKDSLTALCCFALAHNLYRCIPKTGTYGSLYPLKVLTELNMPIPTPVHDMANFFGHYSTRYGVVEMHRLNDTMLFLCDYACCLSGIPTHDGSLTARELRRVSKGQMPMPYYQHSNTQTDILSELNRRLTTLKRTIVLQTRGAPAAGENAPAIPSVSMSLPNSFTLENITETAIANLALNVTEDSSSKQCCTLLRNLRTAAMLKSEDEATQASIDEAFSALDITLSFTRTISQLKSEISDSIRNICKKVYPQLVKIYDCKPYIPKGAGATEQCFRRFSAEEGHEGDHRRAASTVALHDANPDALTVILCGRNTLRVHPTRVVSTSHTDDVLSERMFETSARFELDRYAQ